MLMHRLVVFITGRGLRNMEKAVMSRCRTLSARKEHSTTIQVRRLCTDLIKWVSGAVGTTVTLAQIMVHIRNKEECHATLVSLPSI
jgi:hypothetical protein